jgi:PAS domain S-box-containing protein
MKRFNFKKLNLSQQFLIVSMGIISIILVGVATYMITASISAKIAQQQVIANGRSTAVIEKIDRNFYERFGDVQAFAYNKLAGQTASTKSTDEDTQKFINTMVNYYVLYDLMMICDIDGKVVAVNTIDKQGKMVKSDFLIGKDFSNDEWFRTCASGAGPEGGAWYSDFIENRDVSAIYSRTGWGMAYAAPIRNGEGTTIGVWYNFANWDDVTVGIRKETEVSVQKAAPGAFIVVTNEAGMIIDSDDAKLLLSTHTSVASLNEGAEFDFLGKKINAEDYVVGGKQGVGAYTYKGKNWSTLTFIPKTKFSFSYLIDNLMGFLSVIIIILIITGFLLYKLASMVSKNINTLKNDIGSLSKGELVQIEDTKMENEVGAMTTNLKSLVNGMHETAQFAKQIGEGNLAVDFSALSEKDVLGHALITMRNNLAKIKDEDQQREWSTNGLAKIGEILRSNYANASELYDNVIRFVVKYTNSNQGGMFLLNEDAKEDSLNLVACYAYERKKFLEKRVAVGEGLVGQCFLEQDTIYMTAVPKNYVAITSGLGEAAPSAVILLPLKVNEFIVGVVELASLKPYEAHEQKLLQKFAESIASTISTVRINDRTKQLLEQSQQQAEEMKASEEELRQNMEELTATQEEMQRKESEMMGHLEAINNSQAFIEFDLDGNIVEANGIFLKTMKYTLSEIKGKHHRIFVSSDYAESPEYRQFWKSFAEGKSKTGEFLRKAKDGASVWLSASYTPVINAQGKVVKVIKLARDVSKDKLLLEQSQQQAEELKAQEEELKQNMEELSAIQEDMQRKEIEMSAQHKAIDNSQAFIEFDLDGNIINANDIFLKTMKYSLDEIKGKHHRMFVDKRYAESTEYQEFWKTLKGGKFKSGEFLRVAKDGSTVWLLANYTPVIDPHGSVLKVIKLARDISNEKQLVEQSQKQIQLMKAQEEKTMQREREYLKRIKELEDGNLLSVAK